MKKYKIICISVERFNMTMCRLSFMFPSHPPIIPTQMTVGPLDCWRLTNHRRFTLFHSNTSNLLKQINQNKLASLMYSLFLNTEYSFSLLQLFWSSLGSPQKCVCQWLEGLVKEWLSKSMGFKILRTRIKTLNLRNSKFKLGLLHNARILLNK